MWVGWHYLEDSDPLPALPSAVFLDTGGQGKGSQSPQRLCRPYFKGVPTYDRFVDWCRTWDAAGCRVQLTNEPNLPQEGWTAGVAGLADLFERLRDDGVPGRRYWPGMSPGVAGWQDWYVGPDARRGIAAADGVAVHCYGEQSELRQPIGVILDQLPGTLLWVAECNFGAGREVSRDQWADDVLGPFLAWTATVPEVEAVSYFSYYWPTPDMHLPTPVDGRGTRIEEVLREWSEEP